MSQDVRLHVGARGGNLTVKYDRPVWQLMHACADAMPEVFRYDDIRTWFGQHYPEVGDATLRAHVVGLTEGGTKHAQFRRRSPLFRRVARGEYTPIPLDERGELPEDEADDAASSRVRFRTAEPETESATGHESKSVEESGAGEDSGPERAGVAAAAVDDDFWWLASPADLADGDDDDLPARSSGAAEHARASSDPEWADEDLPPLDLEDPVVGRPDERAESLGDDSWAGEPEAGAEDFWPFPTSSSARNQPATDHRRRRTAGQSSRRRDEREIEQARRDLLAAQSESATSDDFDQREDARRRVERQRLAEEAVAAEAEIEAAREEAEQRRRALSSRRLGRRGERGHASDTDGSDHGERRRAERNARERAEQHLRDAAERRRREEAARDGADAAEPEHAISPAVERAERERAEVQRAEFERAEFERAEFERAEFERAEFERAEFERAGRDRLAFEDAERQRLDREAAEAEQLEREERELQRNLHARAGQMPEPAPRRDDAPLASDDASGHGGIVIVRAPRRDDAETTGPTGQPGDVRSPEDRPPNRDAFDPGEPEPVGAIVLGSLGARLGVPAPARDAYRDLEFQRARRAAEISGARWFVLSADHGLLEPDEWMSPEDTFDARIKPRHRDAWAAWVVARLESLVGDLDDLVVQVEAPDAIALPLITALLDAGAAATTGPVHDSSTDDEDESELGDHVDEDVDAHEDEVLVDELPVDELDEDALDDDELDDGAVEPVADVAAEPPRSARVIAFARSDSASEHLADLRYAVASPDAAILPDQPGLYAWSVDHAGARTLNRALMLPVRAGVVYVGQVGAGQGVRETGFSLRDHVTRVQLHGRTRSSTFRMTLATALAAPLELHTIDDPRLTQWMLEHLSVSVWPTGDADSLASLTERVIADLRPPLNVEHADAPEYGRRLRELRQHLA